MGQLVNVTWLGPAMDDAAITLKLPETLRQILERVNGCIQFHGGFHIRGACQRPSWHSLREAWLGPKAFHRTYRVIKPSDIPFAQDYLGNQFIVRNNKVLRVSGETGQLTPPLPGISMIDSDVSIEPLEVALEVFIAVVNHQPDILELGILNALLDRKGSLEPGQMLQIYPPLCSLEARANGYTATVVSVSDGLDFLATKVMPKVAATRPGKEISFPRIR